MNKFRLNWLWTPLFLLIFSAMFLSTLGDQIITTQIEKLIGSKNGLSNMIWFWGSISLVNAILLPMTTALISSFLVVQFNKKSEGGLSFTFDHFELLTIETLRAWGKCFLWSFVLVLPGIWKFFTYTLTPYVVLFSKKYARGEVDALAYSEHICKKNWKAVNKWLTVFYLVVPIASYVLFEPFRVLAITPVRGTLLILLKTVVELAFHYQMLKIMIEFINKTEVEEEFDVLPKEDTWVKYAPADDNSPAEVVAEPTQETAPATEPAVETPEKTSDQIEFENLINNLKTKTKPKA
ncbi:MAG: hypothetical protein K2P92_04835 [Bdellovibrionaceae bacterium]|nr:hypothetical protein [Pseudobdellovibrionaceae bacterium]